MGKRFATPGGGGGGGGGRLGGGREGGELDQVVFRVPASFCMKPYVYLTLID